MLLIYCERTGPRAEYIFRIFFRYLCRLAYEITDDAGKFSLASGARLAYSTRNFNGAVNIIPSGLLEDQGIKPINPNHVEKGGKHHLFPVDGPSDLDYDPLSAAFYIISRFEEYLEFRPDKFGRFSAEQCLAYRCGFLKNAIAHHWHKDLINLIHTRFPDLKIDHNNYSFCPTFDIDNAYAYRHKGFLRAAGGLAKAALFNYGELNERIRVIFSGDHDPFDTYEYISSVIKKHQAEPHFFILTSDEGNFDNNIPIESRAFSTLVKSLPGKVGLHPSIRSNSNAKILQKELNALSEKSGRKIMASRQHFIVLKLPDTYRNLIDAGIVNDFSMGFPEYPGFRSGMAVAYPYYDLAKEAETELLIHPFAFMEATFQYHLQLQPEETMDVLKEIISEIKTVNGTFYPVWHNESLSEQGKWKGWRKIFETMFELALKH